MLSVLAVAAIALGWWRISGGAAGADPAPAQNPLGSASSAQNLLAAPAPVQPAPGAPAPRAASVPSLRLGALQDDRPSPLDAGRNPFRFRVPKPVVPANGRGLGLPPRPAPPPMPAGPPPPPPITLKFVGIVQAKDRGLRLAVLSDARGVYFGAEGQIIDGRYRIVRIGTETVVVTYVDGTGQRTIPLSGS